MIRSPGPGIHRLLPKIAALAVMLALAGCGRNPYLRSPISAGAKSFARDQSVSEEQRVEDEVEERITENLPNQRMSRDEFVKFVDEAKREEKKKLAEKPATETVEEPVLEPKAEPKTEPKTGPKTETKVEPKPEVKLGPVVTPKTEPKVAPKPTYLPKTFLDILTPSEPKTEPKPEPKSEPKANPKVTPKTEPKAAPAPVVAPKPKADPKPKVVAPVDNGIDEEDELAIEAYTGPKEVVDRPRSNSQFQLSETAAELGAMDRDKYRVLQKDTVGLKIAACNYFLLTALVEAKVEDKSAIPYTMAADFDTHYFIPNGWKKIDVETMKQWFREGKSFDVAIQKNAPAGKKHGHVAVPVGLNAKGEVLVAEAVLNGSSNRVVTYSDSTLAKKFKIYARF